MADAVFDGGRGSIYHRKERRYRLVSVGMAAPRSISSVSSFGTSRARILDGARAEIAGRVDGGQSLRAIACDYGVSRESIRRLVRSASEK